ncbi:hypothetical protein HYALB_00009539 [Hymenoscyphus albidus]|uniref:Cytochrome P450 monooxygenase n=1 Tax=Hymenoscyphus albidus TaxID=595503 RepID=A0A9N9LVW9_9HELO|nr:hypothetical protein HYALB_00009539 [Hymenoscyphus albidus]
MAHILSANFAMHGLWNNALVNLGFMTFVTFSMVYFIVNRRMVSISPGIKAPYAINYLRFAPHSLANCLYVFYAGLLIEAGYQKPTRGPSQFKTSAYMLARSDVNMIVLPASAVTELSSLPNQIANGLLALERDMLGKWTGLHMDVESRLHHKVVQRKVTPNLEILTPTVEEEVRNSFLDYLPQNCENDWVEIEPYYVLLKVTARISGRVLIGFPICRDERWLDFAMIFTQEVFGSLIIMRWFPPWLYSTLAFFLPSVRRAKDYIRQGHEILEPAFKKRLGEIDDKKDKSETIGDGFSWFAELAQGEDRYPAKLTHFEILLALASIHTTLLREVNFLYDMIARPLLVDELRKEIADSSEFGWNATSYAQLGKLDSALRESQRTSPPTLIGLRHIMKQSYTMSDSTFLHKGSYVCVPAYSIENNPANTQNPHVFDGLRDYKKRATHVKPKSQHLYTTPEPSMSGFSYGKSACLGRFFAVLILKTIFVKPLIEYDLRFTSGATEKPENCHAHEFIFPHPATKILIKKRAKSTAPF